MGPNRESRGSTNVSLSRFELLPAVKVAAINRAVAGARPLGLCMALMKVLRSPVSPHNEQQDRSPHPTNQWSSSRLGGAKMTRYDLRPVCRITADPAVSR